ncbi:MAG TPA: phosphoribosyl-AMP cyclohydrolase [Phycisphaerae bacterium]|nr:phosphoribosyl-AMP cyclohydrolase [Phycisphaerae bacterium]
MSADSQRELGTILDPKFDAGGLITAVTVDADTGEVLMVAHMNREALEKTISGGRAVYWSRSRGKFWMKGEESGHVQEVQAVMIDCDQDAVVLKVRQKGTACHNGYRSCFYRRVVPAAAGRPVALEFVAQRQIDPETVYKK